MKALGSEKNSFIPSQKPSHRYWPISAITVDGLCMPKALLNASMKGWKILVFIQVPTAFIASMTPLKIPSTTFPPHSSILSWKYSFAATTPSDINPPMMAPIPPNAAPITAKSLLATVAQSICSRAVATPSPNAHQSVSVINVTRAFKIPITISLMAVPAPAQSKVWKNVLRLVASWVPNSIQSNVVANSPNRAKAALSPAAKRYPSCAQSI